MDSFISYDSKNVVNDVMDAEEMEDVNQWYYEISQIASDYRYVDEIPKIYLIQKPDLAIIGNWSKLQINNSYPNIVLSKCAVWYKTS